MRVPTRDTSTFRGGDMPWVNTWGEVNGVTNNAIDIRIVGDTEDIAYTRKLASVGTLRVGDEVMLSRTAAGRWVIVGKVVSV